MGGGVQGKQIIGVLGDEEKPGFVIRPEKSPCFQFWITRGIPESTDSLK